MRVIAYVLIAVLASSVSQLAFAQPLDRLMAYIEIDTTNPPGNESRAVEFFADILDEAGIEYDRAESAPGRGNIWARLEGGDEPAVVLLHHTDVVPATAEAWDSDPFKAVIRDGMLIGRGALDTKSLGIMHLEAFLALHESGLPLNRDVIFMATADEEAGGMFGAGWLADNRREIFEGVGFLLNEGGRGVRADGKSYFVIEVAQKRPFWLRLTSSDEPGHGSRPLPTSATTRLIAALQRIQTQPFEPRVIPQVSRMFEGISPYVDEKWRDSLQNIEAAVRDSSFLMQFQADQPGLHALLRNTCSITILSGSDKINVVPPVASAELDCRILPDQDADEFLAAIRNRIDDDQISIEELMLFSPAESSSDTGLFSTLEEVSKTNYPGAGVIPAVGSGFTDSHFFRDLGIISYGYAPILIPEEDARTVHGNNERIAIDTFEQGVEMMTEILMRFVTAE
jgi:acetylornithine deacetylase/succinyl-diaminopimelate desuccinylase-like protein